MAMSWSSPAATMFRSRRISSTKLRCRGFFWVANYTLTRKTRPFPSRSMGTSIAECTCGEEARMNRTLVAALIAVSVMSVACDRDRKQQAGQPGAVGTTGHGEATVTEALGTSKAPVFVTDDAEGTRLWKLTRQFYQKRSNRLAGIDDGKPRNQNNDLIKTRPGAG